MGYGLFKLKHLLCLHKSINSAEKFKTFMELVLKTYLNSVYTFLHFKKSLS